MNRALGLAFLVLLVLAASTIAAASILGSVRGLIHDPQHRPVSGATVKLRAAGSAFEQTVTSSDLGEFVFDKVPIGEYAVAVQSSGFRAEEQRFTLGSGHDIRLHYLLDNSNTFGGTHFANPREISVQLKYRFRY